MLEMVEERMGYFVDAEFTASARKYLPYSWRSTLHGILWIKIYGETYGACNMYIRIRRTDKEEKELTQPMAPDSENKKHACNEKQVRTRESRSYT